MLTVVLTTFNGQKTLPIMLDGFLALVPPAGGWKIVAVDDGSTDATEEVLARYQNVLPLKILRVRNRGKNAALNCAIPFFEGDLIILTDDDVVPSADWLVQFRTAADTWKDVTIFGGKVVPRWPQPPSAWILRNVDLGMAYAVTPFDFQDGPIAPGEAFGPNLAVRRAIFDSGMRFDESIGPAPGQYIMGSETDFNDRVGALGFTCRHVRGAIVEHLVRPEQVEHEWLIKRAFRSGRSVGRRSALSAASAKRGILVAFPWRQIVSMLRITLMQYYWTLRRDEERVLRCRYDARFHRGFLLQWFSTTMPRRSYPGR